MSRLLLCLTALFFLVIVPESKSQLLLNELYVNAPGSDEPFEFIELKGTPGIVVSAVQPDKTKREARSKTNKKVFVKFISLSAL
jgi:hypothetical protein